MSVSLRIISFFCAGVNTPSIILTFSNGICCLSCVCLFRSCASPSGSARATRPIAGGVPTDARMGKGPNYEEMPEKSAPCGPRESSRVVGFRERRWRDSARFTRLRWGAAGELPSALMRGLDVEAAPGPEPLRQRHSDQRSSVADRQCALDIGPLKNSISLAWRIGTASAAVARAGGLGTAFPAWRGTGPAGCPEDNSALDNILKLAHVSGPAR